MERNVFVTTSKVPPLRWRQAFPGAEVVAAEPAGLPPGTIVWLHNCLPGALPAGRRSPGVNYVVMHDEPSDDRGMEALAQGASGYCNAHATPDLLQTIASVIRNKGLWVGESLLNRLIGGISARVPTAGRQHEHPMLNALTLREREVALCVARGESNKEIARKLDLAERTIKAHLTGIFEKLGVRDRLRLALLLNTGA
jgi:DNA-binding NarL/FixJ family response regulator